MSVESPRYNVINKNGSFEIRDYQEYMVAEVKVEGDFTSMTEAKDIFNAQSRREAIKRFKAWKEKWQAEEERAVRCMEKDFYHCLHYYSFPKALWKKIRTTNLLEREFREVRRRIRSMGVFPNEESSQRIFYGVTVANKQKELHPLSSISAEILT